MKRYYQVAVVALLLTSLALLFMGHRRAVALQEENDRLREELAAVQRSINGLGTGRSEPSNNELERLRTTAGEVHKLRNEISQLRSSAGEMDRLRKENEQLRGMSRQLQAAPQSGAATQLAPASQDGFYAKENWTFTGYATPDAALQSVVWAMREGDTRALLAGLAPEEMERMQKEWGNKSEAEISAGTKRGTDKISSIRILESRTISDDEVVLNVYAAGGEDHVQKVSVKRIGGEWKVAGPKRE